MFSEVLSDIFAEQVFGVENRNVGNRLKRVLAKLRADPSFVRAVAKDFHLVIARNELHPPRQLECSSARARQHSSARALDDEG